MSQNTHERQSWESTPWSCTLAESLRRLSIERERTWSSASLRSSSVAAEGITPSGTTNGE